MHSLKHQILVASALHGERCAANGDIAEDTSRSERDTARSARPPPLRAQEP